MNLPAFIDQNTLENHAQQLYARLKNISVSNPLCTFTLERCRAITPTVLEINRLKKERNAVILAHAYLSADILYSVADYVGDSYGLSLEAQKTSASSIVFAAVDFMAETAKIINPEKRVFAPNRNGGCSLAESITAEQVRQFRAEYPDYTFVCYINTTADVKAECDVTVTSSNVYGIIDVIENDKIFFLPDRLMAENVQDHLQRTGSKKTLKWSSGSCYVHEQYNGATIPALRRQHPGVKVLAHPECQTTVTRQADYVGSTSGMASYVKKSADRKFFLLTECGLIDRLKVENPEKEFVGSCVLCRYMKSNSLEDILRVLADPARSDEVFLDDHVRHRAAASLERMFHYTALAENRGLI